MGSRVAFGYLTALSGIVLSGAALADTPLSSFGTFDYEARAGFSYSDNVTLTKPKFASSAALVAGGSLFAKRPEGRLRYDAAGDLSYYRYVKSSLGGHLFGGVSGNANYDIVPDSFSWGAQASYNQIKLDLQRPFALGNVEDVISFSTGPTFRLRLGSTLEASFEGRLSLTDYSSLSFDNTTTGGRLVIGKRLSPRSLIGVGGSADRVSYAKQIGLGTKSFDRREVFLRYNTEFMRTRIDLDLGTSTLKGGNVDESNPVARANIRHQLSPSLSIYAAGFQEFTASGAGLYIPPPIGGASVPSGSSILTGGPRTLKSVSGGLSFVRTRTSSEVSYARYDERSLGPLSLTRQTDEIVAKATRRLTPRSHGVAYAKYFSEKASTQLFDSKGYELGVEYGLLFDKRIGVECRIQHQHRNSPTPSNRFTETSIGVFVTYGRSVSAEKK